MAQLPHPENLPRKQMMNLITDRPKPAFFDEVDVLPNLAAETAAPAEIGAPEQTNEAEDLTSHGFRVILYNDDHHSIDEVILQLQKATGCNLEKAIDITLEAHTQGRAVCYKGGRSDCQKVCRVLREIRLQCEVDCD